MNTAQKRELKKLFVKMSVAQARQVRLLTAAREHHRMERTIFRAVVRALREDGNRGQRSFLDAKSRKTARRKKAK